MLTLFPLPIVDLSAEPVRESTPAAVPRKWPARINTLANVAAGIAIGMLVWVWMGAPGI